MKLTVKATKLKRDDVLVVAGAKYRVTLLNHRFGGPFERVSINLVPVDKAKNRHFNRLETCPKQTFNITRKEK